MNGHRGMKRYKPTCKSELIANDESIAAAVPNVVNCTYTSKNIFESSHKSTSTADPLYQNQHECRKLCIGTFQATTTSTSERGTSTANGEQIDSLIPDSSASPEQGKRALTVTETRPFDH